MNIQLYDMGGKTVADPDIPGKTYEERHLLVARRNNEADTPSMWRDHAKTAGTPATTLSVLVD